MVVVEFPFYVLQGLTLGLSRGTQMKTVRYFIYNPPSLAGTGWEGNVCI